MSLFEFLEVSIDLGDLSLEAFPLFDAERDALLARVELAVGLVVLANVDVGLVAELAHADEALGAFAELQNNRSRQKESPD